MAGKGRKKHKRGTLLKARWKTKYTSKTKHLDEIHEDMKEKNAHDLLHQEIDHEKPGCGQHYCLHCARYFIGMEALKKHFRSKPHKKRIKDLRIEPYTTAEAERAAGLGSFIMPEKKEVYTQSVDET